jgi:hypothetical protein
MSPIEIDAGQTVTIQVSMQEPEPVELEASAVVAIQCELPEFAEYEIGR